MKIRTSLLIFFSLFLFACNTSKQASTKLSGAASAEDKKLKFQYAFVEAAKQSMLGYNEKATELYNECLKINPESAASMFELGKIFARQEQYQRAIALLKQAVKTNNENFWYKLTLADMYMAVSQLEDAIVVYEELVEQYPERDRIKLEYATVLAENNQTDKALKIFNEIEQNIGISEEVSLAKNRIYFERGDFENVYRELQNLIDAFPDEPRYYGMLAEIYTKTGKYQEARDVYDRLEALQSDNPLILLSIANFYKVTANAERSFDYMQEAFAHPDLAVEAKIQVLVSDDRFNENATDKEKPYSLLNILLETHPDEPDVHFLYAEYLIRDQEYQQARQQLYQVLELDKSNFQVWEQLFIIENDLDQHKALLDLSEEALSYFPNQPTVYLFNGVAAYNLKKYQKAIERLTLGIDYTIDDQFLKKQFYTYLGEAHHKAGNHVESGFAFEQALEIEPNDAYVLNNYSYYLAQRGANLKKAETMAQKATKLQPDSPNYLDTYAYVLYKNKKYEKALEIAEKAMEKGGKNTPVVVEHYGDILFKNGKHDQALVQWKKAAELGKGSELLDKKIQTKTLIE